LKLSTRSPGLFKTGWRNGLRSLRIRSAFIEHRWTLTKLSRQECFGPTTEATQEATLTWAAWPWRILEGSRVQETVLRQWDLRMCERCTSTINHSDQAHRSITATYLT
jgi:hypothetical protein